MSKLWICDLRVGQAIEIFVRIARTDICKTRRGKDYLTFILEDRTGKIVAKRWEPSSFECQTAQTLQFAHAWGDVEEYEGQHQLILSQPLQPIDVPTNLEDFLFCSPIPLQELQARLQRHIDSV